MGKFIRTGINLCLLVLVLWLAFEGYQRYFVESPYVKDKKGIERLIVDRNFRGAIDTLREFRDTYPEQEAYYNEKMFHCERFIAYEYQDKALPLSLSESKPIYREMLKWFKSAGKYGDYDKLDYRAMGAGFMTLGEKKKYKMCMRKAKALSE